MGADEIRQRLLELQDAGYRNFQCGLVPTVNPDRVIGVRTPALRCLARELAGTPAAAEFLACLPHGYYDEDNLHGLLIERIADFDVCVTELERFLPFVDNWATCDIIRPKVFGRCLPQLLERIRVWVASGRVYTVRFGLEMLMTFFLDAQFRPEYLELAASVRSDEYYVNMMIAWFFATALAKQYDAALPYIEQGRLDEWTHNKAIRKAIESFRVTDAQKEHLRTLSRKRS